MENITCLRCNNKTHTVKNTTVTLQVNGKPVDFNSPAHICDLCQEPIMDGQQMDALRLQYKHMKQNHKLLPKT